MSSSERQRPRGCRIAASIPSTISAEALRLELVQGIGQPDDAEMHAVHRVPVRAVTVPSGFGASAIEDAPVTGFQYFGRDWMLSQKLNPRLCAVVGYDGPASIPDLFGRCLILLDMSAQGTMRRSGHLYLFHTDIGWEIARARRSRTGEWHQYRGSAAEWEWPEETRIVGEVRWAMKEF